MKCPLCQLVDLFYDHLSLVWWCPDCRKSFHYDEESKTFRPAGSNSP
jgi:hypothetical protein